MDHKIYRGIDDSSEKLFHIGRPHEGSRSHSGRYEWGSGDDPEQRNSELYSLIKEYRQKINPNTGKKYTDTEIAYSMNMSTTEFRRITSVNKNKERAALIAEASRLRETGMSPTAIAQQMGKPESDVRSWLLPETKANADKNATVAQGLKEQLEEKPILDIGKGVGAQLGISETRLKNAVYQLEQEGYQVFKYNIDQATNPSHKTTVQVLVKDDMDWNYVRDHLDEMRSPTGVWFENNGENMKGMWDPVSIDSKRIQIRYNEDGGGNKDGVIELRPGVADISLGQNHYAQVRVAVDGTHYLKGMAMYGLDSEFPPGCDIIFNTSKGKDIPMLGSESSKSVLKPFKEDKENPFGSTVRQFDYVDADGKSHHSPINIVNTDEDWKKWSKTLASQFLSKQYPSLAKQQLDLTYKEKKDMLQDILKYPNDTIKKELLKNLADECDSAAVDLKAAALPRQETKVILPLVNIKDNEVYAPTYKNGEEVVLVRYPHQGTFEMPRLIVNNNNSEGKKLLGNAERAIGINSNVAKILSGADFDGDTVTVIPTVGQNIKTSRLKSIEDFDPHVRYKAYDGMPRVGKEDNFNTQMQMGIVSNLITDMTIKGATDAEIARAAKHAMVIIDAEKHNLNWKQSEKDQMIGQLHEKYQGKASGGAATIVSRAKGRKDVTMRDERYNIDPDTGEKLPIISRNAKYIDRNTGEVKYRTERSTKMAEAKDAYELVSRDQSGATTKIETIYADHANKMKALGNEARKYILTTPNGKLNTSSKNLYSEEVESLEAKLRLALMNAPNERLAQVAADKKIRSIKKDNPGMTKDEEKKTRDQVIKATRSKAGALSRDKRAIKTTDREWEAIVAGALSSDKVKKILQFMDTDEVLSRTIPHQDRTPSSAKISRAKAMLDSGYTWSEVADTLSISETTLRNYI